MKSKAGLSHSFSCFSLLSLRNNFAPRARGSLEEPSRSGSAVTFGRIRLRSKKRTRVLETRFIYSLISDSNKNCFLLRWNLIEVDVEFDKEFELDRSLKLNPLKHLCDYGHQTMGHERWGRICYILPYSARHNTDDQLLHNRRGYRDALHIRISKPSQLLHLSKK